MTGRGEQATGWVLHEPAADGSGWAGWLYHYPDGTVVTEDGSVVDTTAGAADPGWFLADPTQDGSPEARWLYQFADGTVVDGEGEVQDVASLLHLEASPGTAPEPEPSPEPQTDPSPEPEPELALAASDPVTQPDPQPDPEPAPEPRPRVTSHAEEAPDSHRRTTLLVAAALAAALVVVAGTLGVLVGRGTEGRGGTATQAASRFDPPDAVLVDGEYVTSRVRPSGEVVVDHWVRTSRPISSVVLRDPRRAFGTTAVSARQVRVETEAGPRPGPSSLAAGARAAYAGRPTTALHVRYVLSGVVRRSLTVTDRALLLTSLDLRIPGTRLPRAVVVTGGRPLAAACTAPGAVTAPRPCGNAEGRGWRVSLEPRDRGDLVAAQVDLP